MSYRTQEILRMIIPGLYLIAMLLILFLVSGGWNKILPENKSTILDVLKGASNVVVLLLPFLGFVVGYLIECIMSFAERLLYFVGVSRPSKMVLSGCSFYILENLEGIKKELGVTDKISNKKAGEALQKAKQKIDRKTVEMFHDTSIMARNIMGSQLILFGFAAYYCCFLTCEFLSMLAMLVILIAYWYHQNCVYVKYVLSELGKPVKPKVQEK